MSTKTKLLAELLKKSAPVGALAASDDSEAGVISKGGRKLIEAWHGSPHKFDKFSMDNIGTGEGAQAYGHGLYFADNKEVGEQYRRVVGGSGGWDGKLPANVGEIAKGLSDEKQGLLLARWQNLGDDGAKGLLKDWQMKSLSGWLRHALADI